MTVEQMQEKQNEILANIHSVFEDLNLLKDALAGNPNVPRHFASKFHQTICKVENILTESDPEYDELIKSEIMRAQQ